MTRSLLCCATVCCTWLCVTVTNAQEPVAKVMTIADKSPVRIVGAKTPVDVGLGAILDVKEVRGDQIDVAMPQGVGTISRRIIIPLEGAVKHWTDAIAKQPRESRNFIARGKVYAELQEFDKAIADDTAAIKLNSKYAIAYFQRGSAYSAKGDHDRAFVDFSSTIQHDPKFAAAYLNRGHIWKRRGDSAKQLTDYNQAILLDPMSSLAFYSRGQAFDDAGEVKKAIADYKESIRLNPRFGSALNNVAWIEATHSDVAIRNGKEAVEYATKLCEVDGWDQPGNLDTLAAAYAEAGNFEKAVKWQMKAVELAPAAEKADYQTRVTLYQSNKPFRDQK